MSEQDGFENWYSELIQDEDFLILDKTSCFVGWNASSDQKDMVIEQQAAELEALREYIVGITRDCGGGTEPWLRGYGKAYGLYDYNDHPTPLLTGVKDETANS